MSEAESILTLRSGDTTVTVHPAAGARIGQIEVTGQPLLVDVPDPAEPHSMMWGSFPMVPWAGRVREGRFRFDGVDRRLAVNHRDGPGAGRAHAIHGVAFDRRWDVDDTSETSCRLSIALDWEFGGIASQRVELFDDRVELSLTVESTGTVLPAEVGWHPWFRKPARLDANPTAMYERDEVGLPTGALVEPPDGPWDDCFLGAGPVVLAYDRPSASAITVDSDCDHWVIFDEPADATCVEPQSGPPDAFNLTPHVVTLAEPLARRMSIAW